MKILVTGATGYIGHRLALILAGRNNEVHVLVRNPNSDNIPIHKNIKVFIGDINDTPSVLSAIKNCKQVYHTAALVKAFDKDSSLFYKVNVEGTRNMLDLSLESGVKKFVFTSSCSVIGATIKETMNESDIRVTPFDNDYDVSKFQAENQVKEYCEKGLYAVIVSPSKVFGPRDFETKTISVNTIINRFINGKVTFVPMPSKFVANYCLIDDVVEGHILAMTNGKAGEKYILGGENISFSKLFQTIGTLSEKRGRIIEIPRFLMKTFAILQWIKFKITNKEPLITKNSIRQIYCNKIFSSEKAINKLGYKITPMEVGLQQTIHFLKNQHHEK